MDDILWNIPEQKSGTVAILGGNLHNFASVAKTAEYFAKMPIKTVHTYLPDSLKTKLPPLPDIFFTKSTATGSFDKSPELNAAINSADIALLAGDFSKNSATAIALAEAIKNSEKPTVWAKDTTDLLTTEAQDLLPNGNITLIATLSQLQKLLRAIYYPKMLLLSMPIQPIKEVLHKFTLSYPVTILTFHDGQIIIASNGELHTTPLEKTSYTPLTLWTTDLPAKITALQAWNPNKPYDSTIAALSYKP
ncbi:hypothetical protein IJI55_02075 [Candidatus Saccharibacteria bacterium]|nr:hypothetical protein [Candidatus Saccharibacteria bacterium]